MKQLANLWNLLLIALTAVGMFVLTLYARTEETIFSQGNIINLSFLTLMTVILIIIIGVNVGKAIKMTYDLRHCTDSLQNGDDWKSLHFESKQLAEIYQHYLKDTDALELSAVGCDIADYINIGSINKIIQKSICEALSSSMTGFGMLGTFLGLIIGLHGFNTDYGEMQNSIVVLLNGIKTAFLTSIYGVVFSLIFNFLYRRSYHNLVAALDTFQDEFYRRAVGNVQDDVGRKLITFQEKQVQEIEGIARSIQAFQEKQIDEIKGIAQTFEQNLQSTSELMANRINTHLELLDGGIKSFLDRSLETQQEQARQLVTEYLEQMNNKVLAGQMKEMRKTFKNIFAATEAMRQTALENNAALTAATNALCDRSDGFVQATAEFRSLSDQIQNSIVEIGQYQSKMAEHTLLITETMQKQHQEMQNDFSTFSEQMVSYQTSANTAFKDFSTSMTDYMGTVSDANSAMEHTIHDLDRTIQKLNDNSEKMAAKITAVEEQLRNGSNQYELFLASAQELTEQVHHNSVEISETLAAAEASSRAVSGELREELLHEIHSSMEELQQLNDDFHASIASLSGAYAQLVEQLDNGLSGTFEKFDQNTAQIAEEFSDMLQELRDTSDYIPRRLNAALDVYFENRGTSKADTEAEEDPEKPVESDETELPEAVNPDPMTLLG